MSQIYDEALESKLRIALESDSTLERVIRGHLFVESALISLIETKFLFPDRVDLARFSFQQKLDLALAHGFMWPEDEPSYRKLNALRNKIAHKLDYELDEQDIADISNCLGPQMKQAFDTWKPENANETISWIIALLCLRLHRERAAYTAHIAERDELLRQAIETIREVNNYFEMKPHARRAAFELADGESPTNEPTLGGE